jgi:hypothetical protein
MATGTSPAEAMAPLEFLVGEWVEQVSFEGAPPGRAVFEWALGGAFLVERSTHPLPEVPDGLIVIAPDGEGAFTQHYFDSRGVLRVYRMTLQGSTLTFLRTEPDFSPLDFSQRYVGEIAAGRDRIDGRWETSHDGGATWELDFHLDLTRAT